MFKKTILAAIVFVSIPTVSEAATEGKASSIGVASFATDFSGDVGSDFSGFALFGTGAFNDNVAFRMTYASQHHNDISDRDLTAVEASLLAGTGLATTGFIAYSSLGFFDETLEFGNGNEHGFNGLMLGGGIGYNWRSISLEFWINLRDASDYEDPLGDGEDVDAASGGLGLSTRF